MAIGSSMTSNTTFGHTHIANHKSSSSADLYSHTHSLGARHSSLRSNGQMFSPQMDGDIMPDINTNISKEPAFLKKSGARSVGFLSNNYNYGICNRNSAPKKQFCISLIFMFT